MDPLTHTLVGSTLARTGLARGTTLAGTALIVGANIPDIDVLSHFVGDDASFAFRRGVTHGPIAFVLLPLLLALALAAIDRHRRRRDVARPPFDFRRIVLLAAVGTWTHPVLDWLNTYGIRLLMPFDGTWFYGDSIFIVDPWLWLLLGGTAFVGAQRRGAIGWALIAAAATALIVMARSMLAAQILWLWCGGLLVVVLARRLRWVALERSKMAIVALVIATLYIVAMVATSGATERRVRAYLHEQGVHDVRKLMVGPSPANPLSWEFVAATEEHYRVGTVHWGSRPLVELQSLTIERPQPSRLFEAVQSAPSVQGTLAWMRFPFLDVERHARGYTVHVIDARYAGPGDRGFGTARVELDHDLRVLEHP